MNTTEMALAILGADTVRAYELERAMLNGGITNQLEKAHFAAQMAHETIGFTVFEESLNYTAKRLIEVFPTHFRGLADALPYAHRREAIGNHVYANRYGNGPESSGDGYRYRGRGFTHLTFKANYASASQAVYGDDRLIHDPDEAMQPRGAAEIAVWYWKWKKCGPAAQKDEIETVTRRINGGLNGLDSRKRWLGLAKIAFGV